MGKKLDRRGFIGKSVAIGVTLATSNACKTAGKGRANLQSEPSRPDVRNDWDFIVVGAGAGGGPVACKLARKGFRVALIESGTSTTGNKTVEIPVQISAVSEDPAITWAFMCDHYSDRNLQKKDFKALDLQGRYRGVLYPRASAVGGCTTHHALIQMYPHDADWSYIESLTGDREWNPRRMRDRYKEITDCQFYGSDRDAAEAGHGTKGWMPLTRRNLGVYARDRGVGALHMASANYAVKSGLIPDSAKSILEARGGVTGANYLKAIVEGQADSKNYAFSMDCNHPDFQEHLQGMVLPPLCVDAKGKRGHTKGRRYAIEDYVEETMELVNGDKGFSGYLQVFDNTLVTKLKFDESKGSRTRVTGVHGIKTKNDENGVNLYEAGVGTLIRENEEFVLEAKSEVIISAGAFNTPQLLMLSGLGPKKHLERMQIPVRRNLPGVGGNLQDRYEVSMVYKVKEPFNWLTGACAPSAKPSCFDVLDGEDPTQSPLAANGVAAAMIAKSQFAHWPTVETAVPDLCLFAVPALFHGYYPGYSKAKIDGHQSPVQDRDKVGGNKFNYLSWLVLKAHTRSERGRVRLRSRDPQAQPHINFAYFEDGDIAPSATQGSLPTHEKDLMAVVEGMIRVGEIMSDPIWGEKGMDIVDMSDAHTRELYDKLSPGRVDVQWCREFVRDLAWGHHASCTCPIGKVDRSGNPLDPTKSVVNTKLQVHGVENLRIVDASVFPEIPGVFIVLPIHMMAEKAADDILSDPRNVAALERRQKDSSRATAKTETHNASASEAVPT